MSFIKPYVHKSLFQSKEDRRDPLDCLLRIMINTVTKKTIHNKIDIVHPLLTSISVSLASLLRIPVVSNLNRYVERYTNEYISWYI